MQGGYNTISVYAVSVYVLQAHMCTYMLKGEAEEEVEAVTS